MDSLKMVTPVCASQLARAWGKAPATITGWILRGVKQGKARKFLRAFKMGGQWMVTPEAVGEFLEEFQGRAKLSKRQVDGMAADDLAEVESFLGVAR